MKEPEKLQAELTETLTKLRDKYECTHDDLVRFLDYAMKDIRYPAPSSEGVLTPKGLAERDKKLAKDEKTPSNPVIRPNPVNNPPSKSDAAQLKRDEKAEIATSKTHL